MLRKIVDWLDKNLVPGWRESWNLISIKGAGVFGAVVTALAAQPELLLSVIDFIPVNPIQRAIMAVIIGAVAFVGPWLLRLWNQEKTNDAAS